MKYTLTIIIPLFIVSLVFTSFKTKGDQEKFSKKVLTSILKNDFKSYQNQIASKENLFQLIDDEPSFSEVERNEVKEKIEKIYDEKIYKKIADAFYEIQSYFTQKGITKRDFEIVHVKTEEKKNEWMTKHDITVTFEQNGKSYSIILDDCVMTNQGLKLLDNPLLK